MSATAYSSPAVGKNAQNMYSMASFDGEGLPVDKVRSMSKITCTTPSCSYDLPEEDFDSKLRFTNKLPDPVILCREHLPIASWSSLDAGSCYPGTLC